MNKLELIDKTHELITVVFDDNYHSGGSEKVNKRMMQAMLEIDSWVGDVEWTKKLIRKLNKTLINEGTGFTLVDIY